MSTSIKWTKEQVKLTLGSILLRLRRDPGSFKYENGHTELSIKDGRDMTKWVSVDIKRDKSRIYMSLGNFTGAYEIDSKFFWIDTDKDIKDIIDQILSIASKDPKDEVYKAIENIFPESTDVAFEQQVLGNTSGKK